jgi:cellulose synthase/poly-beta-1,6-N-acetylglucosamine synthase-like glycosyltransferase
VDFLVAALLLAYVAGVLSLWWGLARGLRLVGRQRVAEPAGKALPERLSLDVVMPVKDEEQNIGACLESMLGQECAIERIIVVNDRSTDGTAAVVQGFQDRYPQVRRVDIAELPRGMYGKPHAIHRISTELKGEIVAFVDSDLRLDPACLGTLVDHLTSSGCDWVAVMGRPEVRGFWEKLVVPLFGAVIFAWYDPRKIADPKWPNALGSALMVCHRESYEAIGGHGAVIDVYDEDSELVRIAKRAGQKISFMLTPELFAQRHYGTLGRTIRGMTRTFVGCIKTAPRLLFTIGAICFTSLLPVVMLALLGAAWAVGRELPWGSAWWAASVAHLIAATALARLTGHTAGVSRRFAFLHPLGCAVLIYVCGRAMLHLWRGEAIAWRGTEYRSAAA